MSTMNQSDIDYIVKLLSTAVKHQDWEEVAEALEYAIDFQDIPYLEEE
jgi:hypothetical protein